MAGEKAWHFLFKRVKVKRETFHGFASYLGETGLCFPAGHNHLQKWKFGMKLF